MKPANILIDKDVDGSIIGVLSDFGITRIVNDNALLVGAFKTRNEHAVSYMYAPPEVVLGNDNNLSITDQEWNARDIYCLSMIIYTMLTLKDPWDFTTVEQIENALKKAERPELSEALLSSKDSLTKSLINIMKLCWANSPLERASAEKVLDMIVEEIGPYRNPSSVPEMPKMNL
jgi:serine/threonine protein kinase